MEPTTNATDSPANHANQESSSGMPAQNAAETDLPPLIRSYNGYEYNLNDPKFKGLGTNAIKRLVKDEMWASKRDERSKAQKAKNKRKRQELRQKISDGLVPCPPKRVKSKNMVLGNVNELQSMQSQIVRCYSANRNAKEAMPFTVSSFDDEMKTIFNAKTSSYDNWLNVNFMEEPYEQKFDKADLIYLSADSDNVAHELEEGKTYIIGGIGLCQNKAVEQGIKTAQLPIGEYIQMASRKVLTVNQVFEIMLKWLECRDWKKAFMDIIPQRKLKEGKATNEKHPDNEEEKEDENEDESNASSIEDEQ
ncbi:tRNA (guanine(9)-N(1))-methyltransferase [Apophysomyces sp. BC1034]|nr:tRNA (guanine(9)-N(1))-methyltransferase [Apophysomyces sp. BC1015]KAG0194773.1 tRNA (guanine(9)-N(1))-methyltransferase [Apophysomyces sp. BC1034]